MIIRPLVGALLVGRLALPRKPS